jgi:hypothetical protein
LADADEFKAVRRRSKSDLLGKRFFGKTFSEAADQTISISSKMPSGKWCSCGIKQQGRRVKRVEEQIRIGQCERPV